MFRLSQTNFHEIEVFQFALNNWFLVNQNKVFPSLIIPSPSVTKLKTISHSHLAWIAIQISSPQFTFWPKMPHICQALFKHKGLWLSALETSLELWEMRSAPIPLLLFVQAVIELVDTPLQYHIFGVLKGCSPGSF